VRINAMAGSLQCLEASRRRWIAELSHDAAALASLQAEVARLTRLVEDFHQLALSDLRALPCSFVPLAPAALLRDAVARTAPRAAAARLALSLDDSAAPAVACWDAQRIEQLLANLLENSLRYTDAPGSVQLSLAAAPGPGAAQAVITLDDSAPGVPEADLPRLFDPLYRADPSRSRRSGGSGLGLAICRAIVHSHGGRIQAAASPQGGLRIVIMLPLQPGLHPAQAQVRA
jgi:two-component system sensor histidine kinase BaeS